AYCVYRDLYSFPTRRSSDLYEIMIGNLIRMAHDMGIKVIAEGVENKMQYDILKRLNCDYIQGYYIQRPLTPNNLISFYEQNNKKSDYESLFSFQAHAREDFRYFSLC